VGRLEGKVALVTGAARGQGRSHAVRMAAEGADIVAVDICRQIETVNYPMATPEDLAETVRQVEGLGRKVLACQSDVRELSEMRAIVESAIATFGHLEVVVANAAVCPLGQELPPEAYTDVFDVDFSGVANVASAALRHLRAGASIMAISSSAAVARGSTDRQGTGGVAYGTAKRLMLELVKDMAMALAAHSIRVNAIIPTNVNTDMLHSEPMYRIFRPDLTDPTREEAEQAFGRLPLMPVTAVEPEDISHAVVFLASDEAKYVTGQVLAVDAGHLLNRAWVR
jgi:SDR family mycofactocin-dependent oxidoreductase